MVIIPYGFCKYLRSQPAQGQRHDKNLVGLIAPAPSNLVMAKSAARKQSSKALVARLKAAVVALQAAKAIAAKLHGVQMPIEPEVTRINRYVQMAKKGDVAGLARRPASPARLASAVANAAKAKGVPKGASSAENLRRWRDSMYPSDSDEPEDSRQE